MDRTELAHELGQPEAKALLESGTLARVAYNGLDGCPRVVPVGFFWDGDEIRVYTATTAPKVRALEAHPDVALTIDAGDTPSTAKSLLMRGTATVEIVDGVPDEYVAGSSEEFERNVRKMYDQMARIRIEPRWARFYDFGAGRLPPFLSKLAERAAA